MKMNNINWEKLSKDDLVSLAERLKKAKNCFIIAHNYQDIAVQKIADYVGDSLQMAKEAAKTNADIVLLCGIRIMAETAKVLNPDKKVLLSHYDADCPLANMKKVEDLYLFKNKYPEAEVVCYVNSSIALKAESTITCTSGNVSKVIDSISKNKEIIFIPDKNLGLWGAYKANRKLIMWEAFCYVHDEITLEEVKIVREKYPDYSLIVHPECKIEVCKEADVVCSTSQMIDYVKEHDKVIIGTEIGLYNQLKFHYPEKQLVPLSHKMICIDMKKTDLKTAVKTLAEERNEIFLSEEIIQKAKKSLNRMLIIK